MYFRLLLPLVAAAIASGQTITTFAGNGTPGYTGDGGPAAQAEINRVVGLATTPRGIFIWPIKTITSSAR